jgi:hypothetical protein
MPPDVRCVRGAADLGRGGAPWVLLVREDETVSEALVDAVAQAVTAPTGPTAYRVRREVEGFGARLRLGLAPVRLALRAETRFRLRTDLSPELAGGSGEPGVLEPRLVIGGAVSLASAVEDLEADGAALAALLRAGAVAPSACAAVVAAAIAAARLVCARGTTTRPFSRWILAVLAGYRALVAYAKLWELGLVEASTRG